MQRPTRPPAATAAAHQAALRHPTERQGRRVLLLPLLLLTALVLTQSRAGLAATDDGPLPDRLLEPQRVEPISADEFERLLEHHRGEVVMVNFWATYCIPCIQELPEIDLLQQRYRDRGLRVLAVSIDSAELLDTRVRSFFAEKAPHLVSYLQTEEDPFDFVSSLDPEWLGGLPTSFFIDRDGEVRSSAVGRLTYQDMEQRVLELLAAEPAAR